MEDDRLRQKLRWTQVALLLASVVAIIAFALLINRSQAYARDLEQFAKSIRVLQAWADRVGEAIARDAGSILEHRTGTATFRRLYARRVPEKKLLVIAVHADYDERIHRDLRSGSATITADGTTYPIFSDDGLTTGSHTGRNHKLIEWIYEYESDSPLATATKIDFHAEYFVGDATDPIEFKNVPVDEVAPTANES